MPEKKRSNKEFEEFLKAQLEQDYPKVKYQYTPTTKTHHHQADNKGDHTGIRSLGWLLRGDHLNVILISHVLLLIQTKVLRQLALIGDDYCASKLSKRQEQ